MFEAVNGRLVGPKTWGRIVEKFGTRLGQSTDCLGGLCCVCVFFLMLDNMQIVLGCMRPETAMDSRFHKVEPMPCERATHGQPTARLTVPVCLIRPKMSMCFCRLCLKMNGSRYGWN